MNQNDQAWREAALERLRGDLSPGRLAHTLSVEKTAEQLARIHGLDADKAARAGLLHDNARDLSKGEMLEILRRAGLPPDEAMARSGALLHAPAGMIRAREVFGEEDPQVLSAIRWHTTGRAGMAPLDKVLYLADMIEPERVTFPGLEEIAGASRRDLDEAMELALAASTRYVRDKGQTLYPDTRQALEDIRSKHGRLEEKA